MGNMATEVMRGEGLISAPRITRAASPGVATAVAPVLRDLEGVISRSVTSARAAGRDYLSQSRAAAVAVLAVRPDLSLGQALEAVTRLREVAA